MSENKTLQRDDIVGKRIRSIYVSPPQVEPDGYSACSAYIELENGTAFQLQSDEFGIAHPIWKVDLSLVDIEPTSDSNLRSCYGETVLEVLASHRWPGMGLHISNNLLVFYYASPSAGAWHVGPCASPVGDPYKLSDTVVYWQQRKAQ